MIESAGYPIYLVLFDSSVPGGVDRMLNERLFIDEMRSFSDYGEGVRVRFRATVTTGGSYYSIMYHVIGDEGAGRVCVLTGKQLYGTVYAEFRKRTKVFHHEPPLPFLIIFLTSEFVDLIFTSSHSALILCCPSHSKSTTWRPFRTTR
jgi:hypothetical protein